MQLDGGKWNLTWKDSRKTHMNFRFESYANYSGWINAFYHPVTYWYMDGIKIWACARVMSNENIFVDVIERNLHSKKNHLDLNTELVSDSLQLTCVHWTQAPVFNFPFFENFYWEIIIKRRGIELTTSRVQVHHATTQPWYLLNEEDFQRFIL
jgi:hypothetical protein